MWADLISRPLYLGILNLTPDSFSDGGRFQAPSAALEQARNLIQCGARMLDLGAESTRPGATPLDCASEWARLVPILVALNSLQPEIPLSLDTRHAEVASRGLEAGVRVLNDVTGFADPAMLALAVDSTCGLIAMRSRRLGAAFLMPPYDDPAPRNAEAAIGELAQIRDRLLKAGIAPERILLDPGFGFGTTFREDLALWEALPSLPRRLDWPADRFCLGVSRKRFLATRAGSPALPPAQRDDLTSTAQQEALVWGYRVFRTHAVG